MSEIGDNANAKLRESASRIENIEAEIKGLQEGRSEIYQEVKSSGHDVKALKAAIRRRKADASELADHEAKVELYMDALKSLVRP